MTTFTSFGAFLLGVLVVAAVLASTILSLVSSVARGMGVSA